MDSQRKYKSENNAKKQIKIDENSGTYRKWIPTIIYFSKTRNVYFEFHL